jgi:hypothetical protein
MEVVPKKFLRIHNTRIRHCPDWQGIFTPLVLRQIQSAADTFLDPSQQAVAAMDLAV